MHALFSSGFRPFFLLTALSAVAAPLVLVSVALGDYTFSGRFIELIPWHGHELLFGMTSALLTGFLLTASPNWTKSKPISERNLIILTLFWIGARSIMWFQPSELLIYTFAPLPFVLIFFSMLFSLKNNRNIVPVGSLLTIALSANYAYIYSIFNESESLKEYSILAIQACIYFFLFIFSGRLIPFFTNNKFKSELITLNSNIEMMTKTLSAIFFLSLAAFEFNVYILTPIGVTITALLLYRSSRFFHRSILREPMIFSLLAAHSWLCLYFPLILLENHYPDVAIGRPSLHAIFVGSLALFSLSIMSRASLGHSGRKITSSKILNTMFATVLLGSLLRVFYPIFSGDLYGVHLHYSMGFWTLGYILFLIKFIPIFITKRL